MRPDVLLCSRHESVRTHVDVTPMENQATDRLRHATGEKVHAGQHPVCGAPSFSFFLRKVSSTGCPHDEQEIESVGIFPDTLLSQRSASFSSVSTVGEIDDGDEVQGVVLVKLAHPKHLDEGAKNQAGAVIFYPLDV